MYVNGKFQIPAALCLEKELPPLNLITDWVGRKVRLDAVGKRQIFFTA